MKWIRSIFGFGKKDASTEQEPVLACESIPAAKVEEWLLSKKDSVFRVINLELRELLGDIETLKEQLNSGIMALESAKLRNEKIPEREMQMMHGNRSMFIKRAYLFNEAVKVPETVEHKALGQFVDSVMQELALFNKLTGRAYQVLQFFYSNEVNAVASCIGKINRAVLGIKEKVEKDRTVNDFNELMVASGELANSLAASGKLASEEKELLSQKEILLGKKKMFEDKLSEFKASDEYKEYMQLVEKHESLKKERARKKQEFFELLYPLEKPLKKMKGHPQEELILKYLDEPVEGLLSDRELAFAGIANELRQKINENSIELKNRMKAKIIAGCERLTKEFLESYRDMYMQMILLIEQQSRRIQNNRAGLQHQKLLKEAEFSAAAIDELEKDIKKNAELSSRLAVSQKIREIESGIKSLTKLEVKLI